MPDAIQTITKVLSNSPLHEMIEGMGIAVANAQKKLDENSIEMLKELSREYIEIGDKRYNLITLGFTPAFYAFTEASFEAKLEFSMSVSEEIGAGASLELKTEMVAVSVNAHYARKFEQSAEGSSSISAKLVSLPPPENLMMILTKELDPVKDK